MLSSPLSLDRYSYVENNPTNLADPSGLSSSRVLAFEPGGRVGVGITAIDHVVLSQPFDYFDELLRRIQDIRTSERRFYQKITDIYSTSVDYDPTLDVSIAFFKTVQNKMHWAITGLTAAEIIRERSDAGQPNMGLTSWRGATLRKRDVGIAKNYLTEDELRALNNLVEQYLVFAEGQAMRRIPMSMVDWLAKLDGFLSLNDRGILRDAGKVSHVLALAKAEAEYNKFHAVCIAESDKQGSDFDRAIRELPSRPAGTDSPQEDAT